MLLAVHWMRLAVLGQLFVTAVAGLPVSQGWPCFVHGPTIATHPFGSHVLKCSPQFSPVGHVGQQRFPLKASTALQGSETEVTCSGSAPDPVERRSRFVELSLDGLEASLDEKLMISEIRTRISEETSPESKWLQAATEFDILRFLRARQRNVYGHDWRIQGADAGGAVREGAWQLLKTHSARRARKEETRARQDIGPYLRWAREEESQNAGGEPLLFVTGAPIMDASVDELLAEFELKMEQGRTTMGVGREQQAVLVVDVRGMVADEKEEEEKEGELLSGVLQHAREIWLTRIGAMLLQVMNPISMADHPTPTSVLEQYPFCFRKVVVVTDSDKVASAWTLFNRLCVVPMADMAASAALLTAPVRSKIEVGTAEELGLVGPQWEARLKAPNI